MKNSFYLLVCRTKTDPTPRIMGRPRGSRQMIDYLIHVIKSVPQDVYSELTPLYAIKVTPKEQHDDRRES
jgi:hypothetical protein